MGPSKASGTEGMIEGRGSSPSQPTQGPFPNLLRKEGSLVSMDKGQPGSPAVWPGVNLSPSVLSQGQVKEG